MSIAIAQANQAKPFNPADYLISPEEKKERLVKQFKAAVVELANTAFFDHDDSDYNQNVGLLSKYAKGNGWSVEDVSCKYDSYSYRSIEDHDVVFRYYYDDRKWYILLDDSRFMMSKGKFSEVVRRLVEVFCD